MRSVNGVPLWPQERVLLFHAAPRRYFGCATAIVGAVVGASVLATVPVVLLLAWGEVALLLGLLSMVLLFGVAALVLVIWGMSLHRRGGPSFVALTTQRLIHGEGGRIDWGRHVDLVGMTPVRSAELEPEVDGLVLTAVFFALHLKESADARQLPATDPGFWSNVARLRLGYRSGETVVIDIAPDEIGLILSRGWVDAGWLETLPAVGAPP
jgi:hypothetical protein